MNESEVVKVLSKIEKDLHSIDISLGIIAGTVHENKKEEDIEIPEFMLCRGAGEPVETEYRGEKQEPSVDNYGCYT